MRVQTNDGQAGIFSRALTVTVTNANEAPTDIALSSASIPENQPVGTTVGTFTTADVDVGNTFTYTLVAGAGDTDNAAFQIVGATLRSNQVFNFEAKSSYSVRVQTNDGLGGTFAKALAVTVTNGNDIPTDIALSNASIAENQAPATTIGTLSTTDQDAGATFTYTLVSGAGSTDNAAFQISGAVLRSNQAYDFETKSSYSVRIQTTDNAGGTFAEAFTITVTNANDAPTNVSLSAATLPENQPAGTTVGTLSTTDQDAGDSHTYSLVAGTGSTDNAAFQIVGASLRSTQSFDFETKSSYSVRIQTSDAVGATFAKAFTITVTDVNDPPVAATDSYSGAIGNTKATRGVTVTGEPVVALTGNVLTQNDSDQDAGDTFAAVPATVSSTQGGTATINANGTFVFLPGVGDKDVTDSFQYQITDGEATVAGTVNVTIVNELVWYVDGARPSEGDGRSNAPLKTLTAIRNVVGDADAAGDTIFLYGAATPYTGGLSLETSQKLFGQTHGLTVSGTTLVAAGGTRPTLGGGLVLGNGNSVQGIALGDHAGTALSGTSIGTTVLGNLTSLTLSNSTGKAIDLNTGTVTATFDNVTGQGVTLTSIGGSLGLGSGTLSGAAGAELDVDGGNANAHLRRNDPEHGRARGAPPQPDGRSGHAVGPGDRVGSRRRDLASEQWHLDDHALGRAHAHDGHECRVHGHERRHGHRTERGEHAVDDDGVGPDRSEHHHRGERAHVPVGERRRLVRQPDARDPAREHRLARRPDDHGELERALWRSDRAADIPRSPVDCTGGTIQGTGNSGAISLTNVRNVSLTRMQLLNNRGSGVAASGLTSLTIASSSVDGSGDTGGGVEAGVLAANVGALTLTNSTVWNSYEDNIRLSQSAGTANLGITGTIVGPNPLLSGNNGLTLIGTSTGNVVASVAGSRFQGNQGGGILTSFTDTSAHTLNVTATTFADNNMGVQIATAASADATFDLFNNNVWTSRTNAIQVLGGATSTTSIPDPREDPEQHGRNRADRLGRARPDGDRGRGERRRGRGALDHEQPGAPHGSGRDLRPGARSGHLGRRPRPRRTRPDPPREPGPLDRRQQRRADRNRLRNAGGVAARNQRVPGHRRQHLTLDRSGHAVPDAAARHVDLQARALHGRRGRRGGPAGVPQRAERPEQHLERDRGDHVHGRRQRRLPKAGLGAAMAEPFLAEIRIFSISYAPKGWALCNGQLLPINQNQAALLPARHDVRRQRTDDLRAPRPEGPGAGPRGRRPHARPSRAVSRRTR